MGCDKVYKIIEINCVASVISLALSLSISVLAFWYSASAHVTEGSISAGSPAMLFAVITSSIICTRLLSCVASVAVALGLEVSCASVLPVEDVTVALHYT